MDAKEQDNLSLRWWISQEIPEVYLHALKEKKNKRIERTERIHNKRFMRSKINSRWDIILGTDWVGNGKWLGIIKETPKRNSKCRCCNNPRKMEKGNAKLTIQERRQQDHETSLAD